MLRRQSEIFRTFLLLGDLGLVAASWVASYAIRFNSTLPVPRGVPPSEPYLAMLPLLLVVWAWVFRSRGLYAPRRTDSRLSELGAVFAGATTVVVLLVVGTFFLRSYFYSRGVILLFWGLSITSVSAFRLAARAGIFALHRRGRHLSQVLVVGTASSPSR
jgi:FlaA1/EpsC-like NDP-sugar epimerase